MVRVLDLIWRPSETWDQNAQKTNVGRIKWNIMLNFKFRWYHFPEPRKLDAIVLVGTCLVLLRNPRNPFNHTSDKRKIPTKVSRARARGNFIRNKQTHSKPNPRRDLRENVYASIPQTPFYSIRRFVKIMMVRKQAPISPPCFSFRNENVSDFFT